MQAPSDFNLSQLQAELVTAGIDVMSGLAANNGDIYLIDEDGQPQPLPDNAAAVLAAHVPNPQADPIVAADVAAFTAINSASTVAELKTAILGWMSSRPGIEVP